MFKTITNPARRRVNVALLVSVVAGLFSAIVKFGWEVPFPPRTPERNSTNPPQQFLEQLGVSNDVAHTTITFNGNHLPIYSFIIHFAFAIAFAVFYCVVAEYWPAIKLWQGMAFGLFLWIAFHILLLPLLGTVPAPWNQPWEEHFSEALGHMLWMWSIELVRRDLRNRITHDPDPEVTIATT